MNNKPTEFIICRQSAGKHEYLRHEGHAHFWTTRRDEAMIYTRQDVAQALADKYQGVVTVL